MKDFFSKCTFTKEILYGKHHLFCAVFNLDREEREMLYRKIYEFQKVVKTNIKSSKRLSIVLAQNTR